MSNLQLHVMPHAGDPISLCALLPSWPPPHTPPVSPSCNQAAAAPWSVASQAVPHSSLRFAN